MCTLVLAAHVFAEHPLVVVANRDEQLERPSSPPLVWRAGELEFLAPRDDLAGGTWLGVNTAGVFVGITNRYLGPKDPARVSRGALVTDALALGSARAIHEAMAKVPAARHNGFHLVYADERDVLATVSSGAHIAQLTLGRGVQTITERSFGAGDDAPRLRRIHDAWARLAPTAELDLDRLSQLLTEHDDADPLAATCIHIPGFSYGTRSGTAISIGPAGSPRTRMLWSEGPPCTTPFAPVLGSSRVMGERNQGPVT